MIRRMDKNAWRLEDDLTPDEICIFLTKEGALGREQILPSYKANRGPSPDGFLEQLKWVKTNKLNNGRMEMDGLEADDLIASAVNSKKNVCEKIVIVSSDKDLAQLVGPGII